MKAACMAVFFVAEAAVLIFRSSGRSVHPARVIAATAITITIAIAITVHVANISLFLSFPVF